MYLDRLSLKYKMRGNNFPLPKLKERKYQLNKKEYRKKYRQEHKKQIQKYTKIYRRNHQEQIKKWFKIHKNELKEKSKKYRKIHKQEIKELKKLDYQKNKINILKRVKKYQNNHRNKIKKYQKNYHKNHRKDIELYKKNRRNIDINFKIKHNLSCRLREILKGKYKVKTTNELLSCTIDFLKRYIQSKFTPRMTWKNYGTGHNGKGMKQWHIDHIKPCANFDLSKLNEQRKCFHYTNLQPLWAKDNLIKSDKI